MRDPLVPFEARLDAPVYVQSNCITPSRRDAIVGALMKFEDLGLKSYGRRAVHSFRHGGMRCTRRASARRPGCGSPPRCMCGAWACLLPRLAGRHGLQAGCRSGRVCSVRVA